MTINGIVVKGFEDKMHLDINKYKDAWGPMFANRVLDIARAEVSSYGEAIKTSSVLAIAIADLLRQIEALRGEVKRLKDERGGR